MPRSNRALPRVVALLAMLGIASAPLPSAADLGPKRASDIVVGLSTILQTGSFDVFDDLNGGRLIVPRKRVFVVTSITIHPFNLGSGTVFFVINRDGGVFYSARVRADRPTQLHFPTGLHWGPSESPFIVRGSASNPTNAELRLNGYLTRDR